MEYALVFRDFGREDLALKVRPTVCLVRPSTFPHFSVDIERPLTKIVATSKFFVDEQNARTELQNPIYAGSDTRLYEWNSLNNIVPNSALKRNVLHERLEFQQ